MRQSGLFDFSQAMLWQVYVCDSDFQVDNILVEVRFYCSGGYLL